ncbi:MAG TPA: cytochrome c [Gemmatimonadales bacterium]|nr:cytochrome c [Gemmatimonadales bacterium]
MRLLGPGLLALFVLLPWRSALGQGAGPVSRQVYEGWRQYSVHCARCHGQDVLGNPVTANLLQSAAPGGAVADEGAFTAVVMQGRLDRGMPGFHQQITAEQAAAVFAYVSGRAAGKISAGRPTPADT